MKNWKKNDKTKHVQNGVKLRNKQYKRFYYDTLLKQLNNEVVWFWLYEANTHFFECYVYSKWLFYTQGQKISNTVAIYFNWYLFSEQIESSNKCHCELGYSQRNCHSTKCMSFLLCCNNCAQIFSTFCLRNHEQINRTGRGSQVLGINHLWITLECKLECEIYSKTTQPYYNYIKLCYSVAKPARHLVMQMQIFQCL